MTRVFTASDACGNTATAAQVITIEHSAGAGLGGRPGGGTIECGEAEPTDLPTATDACDTNPTVTVAPNERRRGLRRGDRRDANVHRERRVRQRGHGLAGRHRARPRGTVLTDVPVDVTMTCGQALPTALPTASDACDAAPAVTAVAVRTDGASVNDYTVTRVFTATDACGNAATAAQVVTYADTGLPAWTFVPGRGDGRVRGARPG